MSSKVNPEVSIVLDKVRHLRLDLNAMETFEELTGLNLLDEADQKKLNKGSMTVKLLRAFLYSCLKHEDGDLTLEKTGELVHSGNMAEVAAKLEQASSIAMPESKGAKKTGPLPKTRQAG